jgi:hypothetical protein
VDTHVSRFSFSKTKRILEVEKSWTPTIHLFIRARIRDENETRIVGGIRGHPLFMPFIPSRAPAGEFDWGIMKRMESAGKANRQGSRLQGSRRHREGQFMPKTIDEIR